MAFPVHAHGYRGIGVNGYVPSSNLGYVKFWLKSQLKVCKWFESRLEVMALMFSYANCFHLDLIRVYMSTLTKRSVCHCFLIIGTTLVRIHANSFTWFAYLLFAFSCLENISFRVLTICQLINILLQTYYLIHNNSYLSIWRAKNYIKFLFYKLWKIFCVNLIITYSKQY